MAMDEEMADAVKDALSMCEIDFDYEFDAPRYFDFSRDEFIAEAITAEAWFLSARSYPHSPLVSKMIHRRDIPPSKDTVTEPAGIECHLMLPSFQSFVGPVRALPSKDAIHRGITHDYKLNDDMKDEVKLVKQRICRSSTLMRPTASHLAKQNTRHTTTAGNHSRFHPNPNKDRSLNSSSIEMQAFKRQKLEFGQFQKVSAKNPAPDLIHKAPKKDGPSNEKYLPLKPKLTVPKDPVLGTAKRAHRIIPKNQQKNERPIENGFKALPLNKKILERPSLLLPKRSTPQLPEFQEFHLRTAERALHNSSVMSSSSLNHNNFDKGISKQNSVFATRAGNEYVTRRHRNSDASNQDKYNDSFKFKAAPLDKKMYCTKRDSCVLGGKQTNTTPKELNLDNKLQHDPPVELFNKLSLCSGVQSGGVNQMKFPPPNKVSKENRFGVLQQNNGWERGPYGCPSAAGAMQVL